MKTMVELSHSFLQGALHRQAVCIDATLGNGADTAWFFKRHARDVFAFEVQPDVLQKTAEKFPQPGFHPFLLSHACMDQVLSDAYREKVDAIIFNFGWCPRQDTAISTQPQTSLQAVKLALAYLRAKGRMALVFYPHDAWKEEAELIEAFLLKQDPHQTAVQKITQFNAENAPFLLCIEKKKSNLTKV